MTKSAKIATVLDLHYNGKVEETIRYEWAKANNEIDPFMEKHQTEEKFSIEGLIYWIISILVPIIATAIIMHTTGTLAGDSTSKIISMWTVIGLYLGLLTLGIFIIRIGFFVIFETQGPLYGSFEKYYEDILELYESFCWSILQVKISPEKVEGCLESRAYTIIQHEKSGKQETATELRNQFSRAFEIAKKFGLIRGHISWDKYFKSAQEKIQAEVASAKKTIAQTVG